MVKRNHYAAEEDARRDGITGILAVIAITVLVGISGAMLFQGDLYVALVDFIVAMLLLVMLLVFRFTQYKSACKYLSVGLMYCLYLYLFITRAAGGTTFMWHYTFPFFTIFLIGASHGAIVSLLLFVPVFVLLIIDVLNPETAMYSSLFVTRYIPSVLVALAFAYLFEKERERFRKQARKANAEQERIIEERTLQLTREIEERDRIAQKLRQSQKMEAIGTMASGVAHDLNNILAGLVTYPELLRSDLQPGSNLERPLKLIEQAGKRAAAVVSDLLTIARNAASVKEPFDLHGVIREILDSPEWQNVKKQNPEISVETELRANIPIINGSQTHIRKSLMNLLHNGMEAAAPGGYVRISTNNIKVSGEFVATEDREESEILITIRDNGEGIPVDHIDHIFEPFYTTKKMGRSGTGLGLSVVWNTVEEHNGSIVVENHYPGAVFEIRLPVLDGLQIAVTETGDTELSSYSGKGTILVVDDEPPLQVIACGILKKLGYETISAETGEEAVEVITSQEVDLVLLDMILGEGIDGYETYKAITALRPDQKAIIVSGFSTSEDVRKVMELGASSIVKKPYTIEELGVVVKACLDTD